ncbi:MAG: ABC transporter permease [Patescibacteria group bacterium]
MIVSNLKIALTNLKVNKSRTLLTILGIVIGIAAVITVISAGQGMKGLIMGELAAFGDNWINIEVKVPTSSKSQTEQATALATGVAITTLTIDDMKEIQKIPNIKNAYAANIGQQVIKRDNERAQLLIYGVSPSYIEIDKSNIAEGSFFDEEANSGAGKVAVIGAKVKDRFFGDDEVIGKNLKIGKDNYRVIGVMAPRGGVMFFDFDNLLYIPINTMQKKMLGINYVSAIITEVSDPANIDETAEEIKYIMRDRHDAATPEKEDFQVTTMKEAQDLINTIVSAVTLLLIAIAGISLLVGGVGIMNVMYVAVVERTFEIGLRKAIGAKKSDILSQFLFEAMIITLLGGTIGFALGAGLSYLVSVVAQSAGYSWAFSLSVVSIILAVGFSFIVGLIFGLYPAKKAADLDPIEALRFKQ